MYIIQFNLMISIHGMVNMVQTAMARHPSNQAWQLKQLVRESTEGARAG